MQRRYYYYYYYYINGSEASLATDDAACHPHWPRKITIRTVDTDVVVLAVAVAQACTLDEEEEEEVWVSFGTGKAFRFLAVHEMMWEKAQALPMFHALTRCDTVSFFAGGDKRMAWEVWTAVPELTQVPTDLTTAPDEVDEDATHTIERFIILLYDRTSTSTDINKTRCKLFAGKNIYWESLMCRTPGQLLTLNLHSHQLTLLYYLLLQKQRCLALLQLELSGSTAHSDILSCLLSTLTKNHRGDDLETL